jgi:hypothetical protein
LLHGPRLLYTCRRPAARIAENCAPVDARPAPAVCNINSGNYPRMSSLVNLSLAFFQANLFDFHGPTNIESNQSDTGSTVDNSSSGFNGSKGSSSAGFNCWFARHS